MAECYALGEGIWVSVPREPAVAMELSTSDAPKASRQSHADNQMFNVNVNGSFDAWRAKLTGMERLVEGWNGYSAPAPSKAALVTAHGFLSNLANARFEPSRVAPSAVGGVGITHKRTHRRVYVEFFNEGAVCALFSDNESEPRSKQVKAGYHEFREFIKEIKEYLNA